MKNVYLLFFLTFINLFFGQNTQELNLINEFKTEFIDIHNYTSNNNSSEKISIDYIEKKYNKYDNPYYKASLDLIIGTKYLHINPEISKKYLKKVQPYIKQHNDYIYINIIYKSLNLECNFKNINNDQVLLVSKKNLVDLKKFKNLEIWELTLWNTTLYINALLNSNKNNEALKELIKLEKNPETKKHKELYCFVLSQIGVYHYYIKNYKEAIKKYEEVVFVLENNGAKYYNILLSAYNNLGAIYSKLSKIDKSILNLKKGLAIAQKEKILNQEANLNKSIAGFYLKQNRFILAEKHALEAHKISNDNNFKELNFESKIILAKVYLKLKDHEKGLYYINSSLQYLKNNPNIQNTKSYQDGLLLKKELLNLKKDYKSIIELDNELISLLDSLNNSNNTENLQKTLIEYETEKKEKTITILKQKEELNQIKIERQKQQIIFLGIGFTVILLLGTIIVLYQKKINSIKNLSLRSKLTRAQFNPHYINNAFTSLQATLIENNLDESLINYTTHVSRFSRLLLESTFQDEWTLFDEKQMIENYLKTQMYRHDNNFSYAIENSLSENELHRYKIPSALTQTVLENAIEHGGYQNNSNGKININFKKNNNNQLEIKITNNLIGIIKITDTYSVNDPSRGLEITKQRIDLHSKIHKQNSKFEFIKNDTEAIVLFSLPLITN